MISPSRVRLAGTLAALTILSPLIARQTIRPAIADEASSTAAQEKGQAEGSYPEMRLKALEYMEEMGRKHPGVMQGFSLLNQAALESGTLETKTKELLCLGIAVSVRCDACIAFHTYGSLEAGATEEEITEVLGVAVMMGGGPSLAYATHVMEALEQFKQEVR